MSLLLLFNQTPYHHTLMYTAKANIDQQPAVAIVVAFMACEIVVEQVTSLAFRARSIEDLEDPVTSFLSGNSLTTDRNRNLYVALTGDRIQDQPFWSDLKASATLRNNAVHSGQKVSREQASHACETVGKVLVHLDGVTKRLRDRVEGKNSVKNSVGVSGDTGLL